MVTSTIVPPPSDNPDRPSVAGAGNDFVFTVDPADQLKYLRHDGVWAIPPGGGGGSVWGGITGTLSNQTDLQNAINLKANSSAISAVGFSGAYNDLTGKPTLGTVAALSYPGGTTNFLRADGTWAAPIVSSIPWGNITGTLAAQTDLNTALGLLAPIASPTFTGVPAAPTAAADTNTTQLATTAYVIGQASSATPQNDGTASSGSSLKYARGDHVHNTDSTRAPLASPALTGVPTSPTAAVDTNTGQVATTAFVVSQAASATPANLGTAAVGTSLRYARGDHVHSSVVTTTGDILYSSSGVTLSRLAIGSSNQILTVSGGLPSWQTSSALTNPMTTSQDIIVGGTSGAPGRLGVGSNGQFLGISGGALVWTTPSGSGDFVGPASSVLDNIVTFANTTGKLGKDSGISASALSTSISTASSSITSLSTSASTGISSLSTGLSTTNSNLTSLSTSCSTGLSTHTSQITSLSTGLSTTNSSLTSLSTSTSTGLSTATSSITSLSTSCSTGLSTHTSQVTSLSTGLSTTNSSLTSLSTSASTAVTQIPQNSQSAAYTLVASDAGKHIFHPSADTTARTFTIPANSSVAYAIGTTLTFVNQNAAGVVTIAITTDTMRLAGAGTTGSRTLAANGIATAIKVTSTEWQINGTGLT